MNKPRLLAAVALTALTLATAACGGGGSSSAPPVAVVPPPPPPPPTSSSFNVTPCLNQQVAFGRTLQDILIPDQLVLDLSQPSGFPNGRDLDDPVVDLELAALFLNLSRHPVTTLVSARVNPDNFDQPLRTTFPFYAPALGSPPLSPSTGTDFNFRSDPASNYMRVDRMGVPAVATVAILSPRKNAYNDSSPAADAAGANVPDVLAGYQRFTDALNDDFKGLGLTPCAT